MTKIDRNVLKFFTITPREGVPRYDRSMLELSYQILQYSMEVFWNTASGPPFPRRIVQKCDRSIPNISWNNIFFCFRHKLPRVHRVERDDRSMPYISYKNYTNPFEIRFVWVLSVSVWNLIQICHRFPREGAQRADRPMLEISCNIFENPPSTRDNWCSVYSRETNFSLRLHSF